LSAQSISGPSPAGLMTTSYSLRFETPPTWRARSLYLYPPGIGWPSYTPRHWIPVLSPPMTCRLWWRYLNPPPQGRHSSSAAGPHYVALAWTTQKTLLPTIPLLLRIYSTSTHSTSSAFSCHVIVFIPNFMKIHHLVQNWLQETDTYDNTISHFSLEEHMLKTFKFFIIDSSSKILFALNYNKNVI
jgi:hypothetical protein